MSDERGDQDAGTSPSRRDPPPSLVLRSPFDRDIAALALPALGALAADPLVSMVDTIFVGRLGVVPLAALGVNTSIFAMSFVVFNFLAYGTTPRVAREVGRGDREAAGLLSVEALTVAVVAGVLATGALLALAGPIVGVMGAAGELREPAISYLRIRALAGTAVLLVTASHGIFRGYQDTRTPLVVTLGLNGVNLVLDPLFIFGFGWGLEGAAWATVAAQWTGALWFLYLIFGPRREELGIRPVLPLLRDLLPFLRIGGELVIRTAALVGTLTLATAVATRVGTVAVAAHQVATQLWMLLALVVDALAVAAQALVAKHRGSGDRALARGAANRLLVWGVGVGLVLAGGFYLLAPLLPRIFTTDPETVAAVQRVLPFVIWMQPLNALVFVWDGVFLGAERFRFLAAQMAAAALSATAVLLLVLPLELGLTGVWWGIVALMAVRGGSLAGRYARADALKA